MSYLLEPGYYEDGAFGVRIENVELIRNVKTKYNFGSGQFLTMEPLTLVCAKVFDAPLIMVIIMTQVPIQRKMIDVALLTEKEVCYCSSKLE